jgi:hypothetical protein
MNSHRLPFCLTLGFILCTLGPRMLATSFVVPSDAELIEKSDAIVRGVVTSSRVVESDRGFLETVYEIAVTRVLKGEIAERSSIAVRSPGGTVDGRFMLVESAAHFAANEQVLLFLTSEGGTWTPTDMTLGKFRPALTTKGYSVLVRDDDDIAGAPHTGKVRLDTAFTRFIEDAVRGEKSLEPYEADTTDVVAPVPAAALRARTPSETTVFAASSYSAQFVAGDGRRYPGRWPAEVMHAGITFHKHDTTDLIGADDDGTGAVRAALAAWTNDGGSAVNLVYGSIHDELAREGAKNMIVFDDPQGAIPGTWTGSGVVATTYLYGTGQHTFDGQTYLTVVGADVVFQDGYTASELSLDEAMTHEIGHAIGIRHSTRHFDATCAGGEHCAAASIMNATMDGALGHVLQTWDIGAARALYPVANAVPLPPTNVIALAALPTGVFVSWSGSDGATSYNVWRTDGVTYTNLGPPSPPAATSFIDVTASVNQGYFYQVQALNASGGSALSGADTAITMIYTDPNLAAGTPIKAVHLAELRTAANLMRALTGSVIVPTYTDPSIAGSTTAKAVHFQEVETVMVNARTSLGLSTPSPLGIASGAAIPASHVLALRSYTQ